MTPNINRTTCFVCLVLLTGCSHSPEDLQAEIDNHCSAAMTVRCHVAHFEQDTRQLEAFLSKARDSSYRDPYIAEHGKDAYGQAVLSAEDKRLQLEVQRPVWWARFLAADEPYGLKYMAYSDEKAMAALEQKNDDAWNAYVADLESELEKISDHPVSLSTDVSRLDAAGQSVPSSAVNTALTSAAAPGATAAIRPGFPCAKASSSAEKLICTDAELASLDARMATAYADLIRVESPDAQQEEKTSQTQWLHAKRDQCRSTYCMKVVYRDRIDDMESMAHALSMQGD